MASRGVFKFNCRVRWGEEGCVTCEVRTPARRMRDRGAPAAQARPSVPDPALSQPPAAVPNALLAPERVASAYRVMSTCD
ncbi:unnamed protein product [Pieris brassicae]|uniref:Uncharacterized protein n=1 Tax=Pieris brassicae TaxID=7116 RepID=A0A9P0TD16_PIEBR|nr:unnamed protein product [Pieris brassicae]